MKNTLLSALAIGMLTTATLAQTPTAKEVAPPPATYKAPPVVTALAFAPNGSALAVSGYREVLLHKPDGTGILARLAGKSNRIESIVYSPDGKTLAVAGGSPGQFGQVQFWNAETNTLLNAADIAPDSLFGASFSPDGKSLGCGGTDNAVRIVSVPEGKLKLKFDNHSDWTLATVWATDNKHILSTGRDRAIKLIIAENGSFVDDINTHTSPYRAMARHPKLDQVLVAGDDGIPRLYQVFRTRARTMNQEDHNLLRVYEKQNAQVNVVAISTDGSLFAVGGEDSAVRVYALDNGPKTDPNAPVMGGKPLAILRGHKGTIHALAFHPQGKQIAVSGFDGIIRLYNLPSGNLAAAFPAAPLAKTK